MKQYIVEGQYTLDPYAQKWALPGTFPRRYWDIIEAEDEDDLAAYLAGQQSFVRDEPNVARVQHSPVTPPGGVTHVCARCNQQCKPQFKYCYRCNNYNKVKAKLAQTEGR